MKIYRRRFIPDENIWLKDDAVLRADETMIVTEWRALKKRGDFAGGRSCYYLNEGVKVSSIRNEAGEHLFYYCDVFELERHGEDYVFNDLLVDVTVREGAARVLDLGEIADALDAGLITPDMAKKALRITDKLLGIIYDGRFGELTRPLTEE